MSDLLDQHLNNVVSNLIVDCFILLDNGHVDITDEAADDNKDRDPISSIGVFLFTAQFSKHH